MPKGRLLLFLPLALFAALALFMAANLGRPQQSEIRSRMVGKPIPMEVAPFGMMRSRTVVSMLVTRSRYEWQKLQLWS
jgi:hypothetical protein